MDTRMDVFFEGVRCNLCREEKTKVLFSGQDWMFPFDEYFQVVVCTNCGLVFVSPRPGAEDMVRYYPGKYHEDYGARKEELSFLGKNKSELIDKIKPRGKILDVGCQKGSFLKSMQDLGWDAYGVDISAYACDYARKNMYLKNIYEGDILKVDLPTEFFDVVTLWQVIEHFADPLSVLQKIKTLLKPGGLLIIECPNFASAASWLLENKWPGLDLPRHLYQFTPRTLKLMLEDAGFDVDKIDHFAEPLMNLVILKLGILRLLDIERRPQEAKSYPVAGIYSLKKQPALWKILRGMFTFFCFLSATFFSGIKKGEIIGVYCHVRQEQR